MAVIKVSGYQVVLSLEGKVFACMKSVSLDLQTEMQDATCGGSEGFAEYVAGKHSWTASGNGPQRVLTETDATTGISRAEVMDWQLARTELDFTFSTDIVGDKMYTGRVLISGTTLNGGVDSEADFSINFQGTGELESVAISA
jgi:hypothetical protein